jgi:hypothetical protein
VTERQLQNAILEAAALLGWRSYHTFDSRRSQPGFPDLVLVRTGHLIFAELKAAKGRVSDQQQQWLDELLAVSVGSHRVQVYVWRTAHWLDGTVLSVLKATGVEARVAA